MFNEVYVAYILEELGYHSVGIEPGLKADEIAAETKSCRSAWRIMSLTYSTSSVQAGRSSFE